MRRNHSRCHRLRLKMLNSLKSRAATGGLSKTCESLGRLDPKMGWCWVGLRGGSPQRASRRSLVQSGTIWCNLVEGFKLVKENVRLLLPIGASISTQGNMLLAVRRSWEVQKEVK
jgi:hypothetical protein